MTVRKKGKSLGYLDICGVPHEVIEATDEEIPALDGLYGFYDQDNERIVIEKGLSSEMFSETLVHEMLHAVFALSGFRYLMGLRRTKDHEELGIRMLAPHWVRAMRSIKNLKVK